MKRLQEKNFSIEIKDRIHRTYPLIRGSETFYAGFLEYKNFLSKTNPKYSNDYKHEINKKDFLEFIKNNLIILYRARNLIQSREDLDVAVISHFFCDFVEPHPGLGGVALIDFALDQLEELLRTKEKLDLASIMKYLPEDTDLRYLNDISGRRSYFLTTITDAIKSDDFEKFISGKKIELEIERIRSMLKLIESMVPTSKKYYEENDLIRKVSENFQKIKVDILDLDPFEKYLIDNKLDNLMDELENKGFTRLNKPKLVPKNGLWAITDEHPNDVVYIIEKNDEGLIVYRIDLGLVFLGLYSFNNLPSEKLTSWVGVEDAILFFNFIRKNVIPLLDNVNSNLKNSLIESFSTLQKIFKELAPAWYEKGVIYFNQRNYDDAIKAYEIASKLDSEYAIAQSAKKQTIDIRKNYNNSINWIVKGETLNKLGKYEEAVKAFNVAIKLDPGNKNSWIAKGQALNQQVKFEDALQAFDEAIKLDPRNKDTWVAKGETLRKLQKYDEAIEAFDEAVKLDPNSAKIWLEKGLVLYSRKKTEEAVKAFEKAIQLDSKMADAWHNKSVALETLGNREEAEKAKLKARDLGFDSNII